MRTFNDMFPPLFHLQFFRSVTNFPWTVLINSIATKIKFYYNIFAPVVFSHFHITTILMDGNDNYFVYKLKNFTLLTQAVGLVI